MPGTLSDGSNRFMAMPHGNMAFWDRGELSGHGQSRNG